MQPFTAVMVHYLAKMLTSLCFDFSIRSLIQFNITSFWTECVAVHHCHVLGGWADMFIRLSFFFTVSEHVCVSNLNLLVWTGISLCVFLLCMHAGMMYAPVYLLACARLVLCAQMHTCLRDRHGRSTKSTNLFMLMFPISHQIPGEKVLRASSWRELRYWGY